MGCFDVADGMGGLTIEYRDKCGLLLLTPKAEYPNDVTDGRIKIAPTTNIVCNNGPFGLFHPYCMPIWGEYNDYGSLENIVRNQTVLGLEKYYERPIGDIMKMFNTGRGMFSSYSAIHSTYGNTGLAISHSDPLTPEWLDLAGFRLIDAEKDGRMITLIKEINAEWLLGKRSRKPIKITDIWILPDTPIGKLWDEKTEKWEDTNLPVCWFEHTKHEIFKAHGPEQVMITHYWSDNRWNETHDRTQEDFCETVLKRTKYGFFGTGEGIQLGIPKEFWKRVLEIRSLSGMFIDERLYNAVTEPKARDDKRRRYGILDNTYPSKYMMPHLGFKFEKFIDGETKKEVEDDGLPLKEHGSHRLLLYTHEAAPDYYFAVGDNTRNMCVDLWSKKLKNLDRAKGMNGEEYDVSTFSPNGIQDLVAVVTGGRKTGTRIPIDQLLDLSDDHFFFEKMMDHMTRRAKLMKKVEKWRKDKEENKFDKESPEDIQMINIDMDLQYDDRDVCSKEKNIGFFGYFAHPYTMYGSKMTGCAPGFQDAVTRFKKFITMMWRTNKVLFPTSHHWQHGEYEWQVEFANTLARVSAEKYYKRKKYYGNDEDEDEDVECVEQFPMPVHITEGVKNVRARMQDGILIIEKTDKA